MDSLAAAEAMEVDTAVYPPSFCGWRQLLAVSVITEVSVVLVAVGRGGLPGWQWFGLATLYAFLGMLAAPSASNVPRRTRSASVGESWAYFLRCSGLSLGTLRKLEEGNLGSTRLGTLVAVSHALGLTPTDVIPGLGRAPPRRGTWFLGFADGRLASPH